MSGGHGRLLLLLVLAGGACCGYVNPNWPHGDGGMWPRLRWRGSVAGGFGRVIPRRCRWGRGRSRPGGLRLCGRGTAGRRCESGGCGRASTTSRTSRLRYTAAGKSWTLYWRDRNLRFHIYDLLSPSRRVEDLLAEIDRDPTCIFWG